MPAKFVGNPQAFGLTTSFIWSKNVRDLSRLFGIPLVGWLGMIWVNFRNSFCDICMVFI